MHTKRSAEDTFGTLRAQPVAETLKKTKTSALPPAFIDQMSALSIECHNRALQTLSLTHNDSKMGDEALIEHARQFESLEVFTVLDGRQLTDYSFTRILTPSHLFLRVFDLALCPHITDKTLFALKVAPFLEELSLLRCPRVTDKGIQAVAKQCKLLTRLNLDWCPQITGLSLLAVARNCRNLAKLSLSGNTRIHFLQFVVLIKRCSALRTIDLFGCTQVNNAWLTTIGTQLPTIEYIDVRGTSVTPKRSQSV